MPGLQKLSVMMWKREVGRMFLITGPLTQPQFQNVKKCGPAELSLIIKVQWFDHFYSFLKKNDFYLQVLC